MMIWMDIIETVHSQNRKRPKRSCYLTVGRINRKRRCWYTDRPGAERHEIFGGPNRQKSIELGFQVDVCPEIHARLHANCDDWARIENRKWKMYYQTKYEEEQIAAGATEEEARADWMALIGRNYL